MLTRFLPAADGPAWIPSAATWRASSLFAYTITSQLGDGRRKLLSRLRRKGEKACDPGRDESGLSTTGVFFRQAASESSERGSFSPGARFFRAHSLASSPAQATARRAPGTARNSCLAGSCPGIL